MNKRKLSSSNREENPSKKQRIESKGESKGEFKKETKEQDQNQDQEQDQNQDQETKNKFKIDELNEKKVPDWLQDAKLIGKGGFGQVYLKTDQNGNTIAIKVIPKVQSKQGPPEMITQIVQDEITVLRAIEKSCNLFTLCFTQFGQDKTNYYILTKYLDEYITLEKFIANTIVGELPPKQHIFNQIVCQLVNGLDHLHEIGIVHRDIKPGNIMISINENEKVSIRFIDFGFACIKNDCSKPFSKGTLDYMAPEIIHPRFDHQPSVLTFEMSKRADVWSLGMTILELFMKAPKTYQEIWNETYAPDSNQTRAIQLEMKQGEIPYYLEFLDPYFEDKFPKVKIALDSMLERDPKKRELRGDLIYNCSIKGIL